MNRKQWEEFKKRNSQKVEEKKTVEAPKKVVKTEIKTKKVMAGIYTILLNGENIGTVEALTTGWLSRPNNSSKVKVERTVQSTKNKAVGEYVKRFIEATI